MAAGGGGGAAGWRQGGAVVSAAAAAASRLVEVCGRLDRRGERLPPLARRAAGGDQQLDHLGVLLLFGVVQRRAAPAVLRVRRRAGGEEALDDGRVALGGGEVERRPLVVVALRRLRAVGQQHLHRLNLAQRAGGDQRELKVGDADAPARRAQELRHVLVAVAHRVVQRAAAPPVRAVEQPAAPHQLHRGGQVALRRGDVERRAPVVVGEVDERRRRVEQLRHPHQVVPRRREQHDAARRELVLVGRRQR